MVGRSSWKIGEKGARALWRLVHVGAPWLKAKMQATKGLGKETSQAKKPEKDRDYQNTLLVKQWLAGD